MSFALECPSCSSFEKGSAADRACCSIMGSSGTRSPCSPSSNTPARSNASKTLLARSGFLILQFSAGPAGEVLRYCIGPGRYDFFLVAAAKFRKAVSIPW